MRPDTSRAPAGSTRTQFGLTRGERAAGQTGRRHRARGRWRRRARRLRHRWSRAAQTVTPTGRFVLAAVLLAAVAVPVFGLIEAWAVVVAGGFALAAAIPFLLGGRAYLIRIVIDRMRVTAGATVQLGVEVENAGSRPALPATAELPVGDALRELPVPFIGAHETAELPVSVPTHARGVIEVGPLTLARRDPLGLLHREVRWRDRHLVHVHPRTVPLPTGSAGLVRDLDGAASRRLTDSDLSFHAVRDYVHGDALRHVHWRSTAKTGTLMVRQYEESQTARSAILFDARREEYGSDAEFELGVSVAASLSLHAVREGRERFVASAWAPGRLRPSIDGLEELPAATPDQLLDGWAELQAAEAGRPIEHLSRGLAESRRPLSFVAIVTGSVPGPQRLRRAAIAFPPDVAVLVVRSEELADPAAQLLDVCTAFTVGALTDLPQLMVRGGLG